MSASVRAFLKSSLAWLALGVTLGVAMAAHPAWTLYRLAHIHMMLLGFVAMMIFGVAYHVIPRFAGFPLHWPAGERVHWWLANARSHGDGVGLHAPRSCAIRGHDPPLPPGAPSPPAAHISSCYLIWRTIDGPARLRPGAARSREAIARGGRAGRRPLTVVTTPPGPNSPAA